MTGAFVTGACADEGSTETTIGVSDGTGEGGDGDGDPTGDGDGDPTGDGDGDITGDGDGDSTGDGDGDPTGDGDGDLTGDGDGDPGTAPEVHRDPTYSVSVSTITYGQGMIHSDWGGPSTGTIDLELDLYEPTDAPPGRPAMVVVHGGGFTGGSKTAMAYTALAEYFAERGWVTMSINYRITDDHGTVPDEWANFVVNNIPANGQDQMYAQYPAARDAKAAVRWLYANADTYQVDLDYVTAAGGSAGAILTVMLGVSGPEDFRDEIDIADDPTLATTNLDESANIHTILEYWGASTPLEILEVIDGVDRFDATDAPVCIVHGTEDPAVPIEAGEALRDAYIQTGVPYAFHPLEGAGHGAWEETIDGMSLHEVGFDFVVEHQGLVVLP